MIRLILVTILATIPALVGANDDMPEPMAPVKVSIAIPTHHGHKSLNDGDHFHVLITNVSGKPIRLWTDRFSWGYDNLSFELIGDDGEATRIAKKPRGGSYVLNVDWSSDRGRDLWESVPAAVGKETPTLVKLRAVYEVQPDDESRKLGVWTGKIT